MPHHWTQDAQPPLISVQGGSARGLVAALLRAIARAAVALDGGSPLPLRVSTHSTPPSTPQVGVMAPGMRAAGAVCQRILRAQHLVLDADERADRVLGGASGGEITWYGLDPRNPLILDHLDRGGDACSLVDGELQLMAGPSRVSVLDLSRLPVTLGGASTEGIACSLAALAAAVSLGVSLDVVRAGLSAVSEPHERFVLGGAQVLLITSSEDISIEQHLRLAAGLPGERRVALRLDFTRREDAAVQAAAEMAGVELLPGNLESALSGLEVGDVLLVLSPVRGAGASDLLRRLQRQGWSPGDPVGVSAPGGRLSD